MYKATVFLCHGATAGQTDSTNGWTHVHCLTETGANGDSFSPSAKWQYAPGSNFAWRVVVVAADKTANAGGAATISTGAVYPAWWTAGGGSGVIHVWLAAEAYGSAKTGESWRHAVATLSEALALVTDGKTEIWIADDLLLDGNAATASPFALTVRGGFTGAENAASARSAGTVSRLDANETYADILRLAHTSGKAVLERLAFLNSREHGLYKTGAGSLELRDCRFERNGRCPEVCTLTGRGAYLTGGAGATLLITNCVFNDNRILMGAAACGVGGDTPYQSGCGAYVTTFQRFDLVDTLFSSNGCPLTAAPGRGGTHGFALAIDSAPVHALRCDFIANVGSHYEASAGAIVCVYGASDGSSFTNCLWTGNFHNPYSRNGTRGGALEINMSSAAYTCSLGNCTIAYNLVDAITCAAGLQVTKGTIDIGDSIIYGNSISATYNSAGADVYVANVDSSVTLRHSLLASSLGTYASSASGTGVILGDGMIYGDPLFATPTADYIANISSTAPGYPDAQAPLTFADWAANGAFDLHLCSVQGRWNGTDHSTQDETTSPAIDRAAATTPVGDEPAPNGNRRNLGRYGGTAEASLTPSGGVPAIDAVSVNPAYDYTQPAITVTVGGTGAYAATVTFCFGTILPGGAGTNGWQAVRVQEPVGNGDVVVMPSQTYYPHGATVYWRVIVTAEGAEPIVRNGSYEVTDETPVFLGRGGGANVIHLRPAAKGTGTGDNWADAVTTFDEARDLITETRNQIWFAGDVARDEAPTVQQILKSVTILGGFAGSEDAATDRVAGARTTIDGAKLYNCLAFGVAPDVTLEIEDFVFTRSLKSAFTKTGAGSLTVRNCRFTDNGWFSTTVGSDVSANRFQGGGASVTSGRCVFYNCLFDGNLDRRAMIYGTDGHGLYASGASLALYDCSFVTNGLAESITSTAETGSPCREGFVGTAVYALRCRDVTAAGCRFIGQRMTEHSGGSVFCIAGASVASQNPSVSHSHQFVISNCLFAANSSVQWISSSYPCNSAPLAFLGSDYDACPGTAIVERCTFAYNSYASGQDAAALLVTQGKSTSTWFVRVRNSIFSGNLGSTFVASAPTAADIRLNGYVEFDMDYSLIAGVNPPYVINSSSRSVTFGDHFVLAPDALFVTPQETFLGALTASGVQLPTHASRVIRAKQTDPTAWNFHLRGSTGYDDETTGARLVFRGRSPAIDAGDPAADYTSEPPPNGRRLNLGFYGGTPWATRTAFGGMCIIIR